MPYGVYRMVPPEITHTPGAAAYARDELERMGPMSSRERTALAVFCGIVLLWVTSQWHTQLIGFSST